MRRWVWAVLMICFAGYMAGCSVSGEKGDPPPPDIKRDTPEGLIEWLGYYYEKRDIDKYNEALDDYYLFTFTSDDADKLGLPPDQPWWGKTEDAISTRNMFESSQVTKIEMDLPIAAGPWITEDGLGYRLEPSIKVTTEQPDATEPTVYWVFQSWLDVEIIEDPFDSTLWVFKGIQESLKSE
jgi:hypothetical protein